MRFGLRLLLTADKFFARIKPEILCPLHGWLLSLQHPRLAE